MSKAVSVYDLLERQDRNIFREVVLNSTGHPLLSYDKRARAPLLKHKQYKYFYIFFTCNP